MNRGFVASEHFTGLHDLVGRPDRILAGCLGLKCYVFFMVDVLNVPGFTDKHFKMVTSLTGWWFGTWLLWLSIYIGNVIIPTDFHSIIFQRG